jgi:hypothetical protein
MISYNATGAYTYRLTDKGVKVALLFLFFHKRLCGPLASNLFHHRRQGTPQSSTGSRLSQSR